jgi:hypothetical protein
MLRTKKYKYCVYDLGENKESLVDLKKDPGEMNNLAGKPEYQKILELHRNYLIEWSRKYNDPFAVKVGLVKN